MSKKVILLLSGGIDSTVLLAHGLTSGCEMYCLSVWYGSKQNRVEYEVVKNLARLYNFVWKQVHLELPCFNVAMLEQSTEDITIGISSVVPMRNTLLLSLGAAWAYEIIAQNIWLGANKDDEYEYPDCRPIYLTAYNEMLKYAMGWDHAPKVEMPLIEKTKKEIVQYGQTLGIDFAKTWTCYQPSGTNVAPKPCNTCPACQLRRHTFSLLGIPDPAAM